MFLPWSKFCEINLKKAITMNYIFRKDLEFNRSVYISDTLEDAGYGLITRKGTKCTHLIGQYAELLSWSSKFIINGGMAEHSWFFEKWDIDGMRTMNGFKVKEGISSSSIGEDVVPLYMVRCQRYPGYCKLRLLQKCYDNLQAYTKVNLDIKAVIKSVVAEEFGLFISSKLVKEFIIINVPLHRESLLEPVFTTNGPAKTNNNVDYVIAFEIDVWPQEAKKWLNRSRQHGWPRNDVLDKLQKEVSCYVVPVGNKLSKEFDLQWKLSFVEIERELIWGMNDTQFKCYICLKRLMKTFMGIFCSAFEKISTYQMKNLMFVMCAIIPETEWLPKFLLRYVRLGLRKLQTCIWLGYNAHFILPELNLWQNVGLLPNEKRSCVNYIEMLIAKPESIVEIIVRGFHIYNYKVFPYPDIRHYAKRCGILLMYGKRYQDVDELQTFYDKIIDRFPEADILRPCMTITLAGLMWRDYGFFFSLSWSSYFDINERHIRAETEERIGDVVRVLEEGYDMDYLTASLTIAMIFFNYGKYLKLQNVLRPKFLELLKLYITHDGMACVLNVSSGKVHPFDEDHFNVDDLRAVRQNLVLDFLVETPMDFLPFPLKLQKYLSQTSSYRFAVNPVVLGHYVLLLSEFHNDPKADTNSRIKKLCHAVFNSPFHSFYFFHLHLLGHSYYVMGKMKEAYWCFAMSAVEKPSLLNAAIYHIAIMINNEIRRLSGR